MHGKITLLDERNTTALKQKSATGETPLQLSQSLIGLLMLLMMTGLGVGCTDSSTLKQTAFRVHTDLPAERNENVAVYADQPFQIWFELNQPTSDSLRLQYRKNEGAWTDLEVAAFPYPESASPQVSISSRRDYSAEQDEITWPLVIRRFADGAVMNNEGDVFSFRLTTTQETPIQSRTHPELTLSILDGHLGGTFVETPGPIGPWQASNGDLYFIMEPTETDNVLMMVKSKDEGKTWSEIDGANRPVTDDLEGVASSYHAGIIHILHQTSDNVWYHAFNTSDSHFSPDAWTVTDEETAAPAEPPTQVAAIATRSDGSMVGLYGGPLKIHYKIRNTIGPWTQETILDPEDDTVYSGPQVITGKDNVVHLAYTGSDGTVWYRTILPDGTPSKRQLITQGIGKTEYDVGSILPLAFLQESNTVVIIYRMDTGTLWERRITGSGSISPPVQVSDQQVVQNAVDSDQVGADAISHQEHVYVLFIEKDTGTIYATHSDENGTWQPATVQVDSVQAQWIRGALHKRSDGTYAYAYVYDAGSNGGAGMNRFGKANFKDLNSSLE